MSETTLLVIDREQMVRICQNAGFKSAGGWTNKQLFERSTAFSEADLATMKSQEDKEVLDKILSVNERKEEFEVVGEKNRKSQPKEHVMNGDNLVAVESKEKTSKSNNGSKNTNRFGNRPDSQPGKINNALSTTAKSITELATESGLSEKRVEDHLKYWAKRPHEGIGKYLEKLEDGTWKLNDSVEDKEEPAKEEEVPVSVV